MNDIKNMSEEEIQEIFKTLNDELIRRQRARRTNTAQKALDALRELVKVAPNCYMDMTTDDDWDEAPVFFNDLVEQWETQNFHFD